MYYQAQINLKDLQQNLMRFSANDRKSLGSWALQRNWVKIMTYFSPQRTKVKHATQNNAI